jgi:hypothetical protein
MDLPAEAQAASMVIPSATQPRMILLAMSALLSAIGLLKKVGIN